MRGCRSRLGTFVALAVAACALAATASAAAWVTIKPAHLPLTFKLPSDWKQGSAAAGSALNASSGNGAAKLAVATSHFGGSFADFASGEAAAIKHYYKAKYPSASVKTKVVTLPSGKAVEADIVGPLALRVYALQHKGKVFSFTYYANASSRGSYWGTFGKSAVSIRFKK